MSQQLGKNGPKDTQVTLHMMENGNELFYHDSLVVLGSRLIDLQPEQDRCSKSYG